MISFIIIGRNESWKLTKCIESVFDTAKYSSLEDYEVLYVDSQSTDNSIELVNEFNGINVFLIKGECNAAIARNIGAVEAKGDILCFIDGDMEIIPSFLHEVLDSEKKLKYDYVTGHLDDLIYDINGVFLKQRSVTYKNNIPETEDRISANGGFFIMKKEHWVDVGGMRTKYKRSQDLDLVIRLNEKGINTIRVPYLMVLHHTIDYRNEERMWKMLLSGSLNYYSLLFRDHFFNPGVFLHTVRNNYTSFLLMLSALTAVITPGVFKYSLLVYFIVFFFRVFTNTKSTVLQGRTIYFLKRILYQLLRDFLFWAAFLFFFPRSPGVDYVRTER